MCPRRSLRTRPRERDARYSTTHIQLEIISKFFISNILARNALRLTTNHKHYSFRVPKVSVLFLEISASHESRFEKRRRSELLIACQDYHRGYLGGPLAGHASPHATGLESEGILPAGEISTWPPKGCVGCKLEGIDVMKK